MLKILDYEAWMLRRLGVCRARRLRVAKVDLHVDLVGLRILDVEFSVKCSSELNPKQYIDSCSRWNFKGSTVPIRCYFISNQMHCSTRLLGVIYEFDSRLTFGSFRSEAL